ncbi:MAG: single-stranded-DNA-specific exonuclease RecJ [Bacteroidota bacterium]|jgi:single-stranded-DNA-specific exonuclease
MEKKWVFQPKVDEEKVQILAEKLNVELFVGRLLVQRGLETEAAARAFFRPSIDELHDPFLMKDMDAAVNRINQAIKKQEGILLFGDYDVDGTTAVALMYEQLIKFHPNVHYYIPDRYKEGYGLSQQGIDYATAEKCTLMITLDCGIKSNHLVEEAKKRGIDFIICDHHQPGEILPAALVLDPKRLDCGYPFKELSGCGVGFKLMQALHIDHGTSFDSLFESLDLLALSIGADIVDVTGENRILCYHGLIRLNQYPRRAFEELLTLAGKKFPLSLTDVVFVIAPRVNAAGRIRSGKTAVDWMLSANEQEIKQLAQEIHDDNTLRRTIDQSITEEALLQIASDKEHPNQSTNLVFQENWHKGVVGIVASRIIESHYRPTIVLTESNGLLTGSARSVGSINLYEVLESCKKHLTQFGGHHYAAGLTMPKENLHAFRLAFDQEVKQRLNGTSLEALQHVDINIDLNDIQTVWNGKLPRIKKIIDAFEPFGPGNMKPVFCTKELYATDSRILKEKHLKLRVAQADSKLAFDAIGFNLAEKEGFTLKGMPFEMAYTLETNEFNGKTNMQFNIKDIRASE